MGLRHPEQTSLAEARAGALFLDLLHDRKVLLDLSLESIVEEGGLGEALFPALLEAGEPAAVVDKLHGGLAGGVVEASLELVEVSVTHLEEGHLVLRRARAVLRAHFLVDHLDDLGLVGVSM